MRSVQDNDIFCEVFAQLLGRVDELLVVVDEQLKTLLIQIRDELSTLKKYPLKFLDDSYINHAKDVVNQLSTVLDLLLNDIREGMGEDPDVIANVKKAAADFTTFCLKIKDALAEPIRGKNKVNWFWVSSGAFSIAIILFVFSQPARDFYSSVIKVLSQMGWCGIWSIVFVLLAISPWLVSSWRQIWKYISAVLSAVWEWRWRLCVPATWKCKEYHTVGADVGKDDLQRMLRLYFESFNTDYALMINGAWGAGKTYYMQHSIRALLHQCHKKSLYVSLNGIKSFDEVAAQIVFATRWSYMGKIANSFILPFAAKWLPEKTISFICSQLKNLSEKKSRSSEFHGEYDLTSKDYVIIVDDIERVAETNDDKDGKLLMELLGRLFDEFISKGYHVVLVGAESEMKDKTRFFKAKEKYVRHTIDFVPDIPVVIDSIVVTYYGHARRHARLVTEFLKSFAMTYHVDNIRTIKRMLDGFVFLASKVKDEALLSKSANRIMEIFAPTILERVFGVLCDKSIDDVLVQTKSNESSAWCNSLAALYDRLYSAAGDNNNDAETQPVQQKVDVPVFIRDKYKNPDCICRWTKDSPIVYFAITGLIDEDTFRKEIQSWIPPAEYKYAKALDIIWRFESIEDSEFAENYPLVVKGLEQGEYNADRVNLACDLLFYFKRKGWLRIDCEKVIQDAVKALTKRWSEHSDDYINPMLLHNQQEEFLQPIVDAIREESNVREKKSAEEDVSKFITALTEKDKESACAFLPHNQSWQIFDKIVKVGKAKDFCNISNWGITLILVHLKDGAVFIRPSSRGAIEQIVQELNIAIEACDIKKTPIRKDRLEALKAKFSEILNSPEFQQVAERQEATAQNAES